MFYEEGGVIAFFLHIGDICMNTEIWQNTIQKAYLHKRVSFI